MIAFASVTGSIAGTVTDATGGVIPGATVTATNVDTGVKVATKTNATGAYSFPELNGGPLRTAGAGERGSPICRRRGSAVDVNAALRFDATMKVTGASERVEVAANCGPGGYGEYATGRCDWGGPR